MRAATPYMPIFRVTFLKPPQPLLKRQIGKAKRMPEPSSSVLQQFRQGNLDAFESLFREHQSAVYRWILRMVRDTSAAEDLTVETFWRISRPMLALIPRAPSSLGRAASPPARRSTGCVRGGPNDDNVLRYAVADPRSSRSQSRHRCRDSPENHAGLRPFAAPPAHRGCSCSGRGAATQRSGRRSRHLRRGRKLRVFRALRLLRKDLERQGITP